MTGTALPDEVRGDATVPGGTLADVPQRRRRRTAAQQTMSAVRYVLLVIFAVLVLTPAYALLVTSFKMPSGYDQTTAWKLPRVWSVGGWQAAWDALAPALGRSLVMAVLAAIISAILGSLNGYVFAKWKFPGSHVIFVLFLFGMFIPYQAIMIPLSGMMLDIQQGAPWFAGIPTLVLVPRRVWHPHLHSDLPQLLRDRSALGHSRGRQSGRRCHDLDVHQDRPTGVHSRLRRDAHLAVHQCLERLPLCAVPD